MTTALKLDLSARAFALALLATVVALAGASWFVVISPKHDKAATLQTKIESDQTRLATAARERAQEKAAVTIGKKQALDAALPKALAMPQILVQLNAMADQAGVTLDTVTPGSPATGVGYIAEPLTVVIEGQYFSIRKFLRLVRNQVSLGKVSKPKFTASGRLFDVSSMQLQETEPAPTLSVTFSMNAYYYSPAAAAPQPATSTTSTSTTAG